jgi:DNA polymerase I-like protein with 3'-5' exonuclease and polymerase domains
MPRIALPKGCPRFLAIDTETTSTRLHGPNKGYPFAISTCDYKGETWFYQAYSVDPFTRKPSLDIFNEAAEYLREKAAEYDCIVFHNAPFDLAMLDNISCYLYDLVPHDTLLMSHTLWSGEEHDLKTLGIKYLDIRDDDQRKMKAAITRARAAAKSRGYPRGDVSDWDAWMIRELLSPEDPDRDSVETYAVRDAVRTARLFMFFWPLLDSELIVTGRNAGKPLRINYDRRIRLMPRICQMQQRGFSMRPAKAKQELVRFSRIAEHQEDIVRTLGGEPDLNLRSSPQKQDLLFHKLRFRPARLVKPRKVKDPETGEKTLIDGYSVDGNTLLTIWSEQLGHIVNTDETWERAPPEHSTTTPDGIMFEQRTQIIEALLRFADANTARNYLTNYIQESYPVTVKVNGRVGSKLTDRPRSKTYRLLHSHINETGTKTTRWSSSDPATQNISDREEINLREAFGPRPGWWWLDIDFSNLELRIYAHLAHDTQMQDIFDSGQSLHAIVCRILYPHLAHLTDSQLKKTIEYKRCKNGNFSIIYGASEARADATYGFRGAYSHQVRS